MQQYQPGRSIVPVSEWKKVNARRTLVFVADKFVPNIHKICLGRGECVRDARCLWHGEPVGSMSDTCIMSHRGDASLCRLTFPELSLGRPAFPYRIRFRAVIGDPTVIYNIANLPCDFMQVFHPVSIELTRRRDGKREYSVSTCRSR